MIYVILGIIAAVLLGAAVVGCCKPGKKDGICKYGEEEDKEK